LGHAAEAGLEPDEDAALQAELAQRRLVLYRLEKMEVDGGDKDVDKAALAKNNGRKYRASRTPLALDALIGSLREKWRVLPHFFKLRGLMKQLIDLFDHFVCVEMKHIVQVSIYYFC